MICEPLKNTEINHLRYKNPELIVLEGKATFQSDCSQQQQKPQQRAVKEGERNENKHFFKKVIADINAYRLQTH